METGNGNTAAAAQKPIVINRTFNLPVDTVWKAWSDPESFKKWWGQKNYTCPHCTIEFKVGGKYLASMLDKRGGKELWSGGTYKEIVPLGKIVMTDHFSDSKGNIAPPPEGMPGQWPEEL